MALRAGGSAPNITAFHFRESVALVSGQCGLPQWPGSTRLSRGILQQRGHVSPPVAALGGNGTSPLDPVRCSVVSASGKGFAIAKQHQAVALFAPATATRFALT